MRKTLINWKYQRRRLHANEDLKRELPKLEKRIRPIIEQCSTKETDLQMATIEKNVFVFWWDGFETAPFIVKKMFGKNSTNFPGSFNNYN